MEIWILVVVAAVSAGFAVKAVKNGFKTAPKPAMSVSEEAAVPVSIMAKVFPQPVRMDQLARGLRVNFSFARNKHGGWVKSFRGRRVVIAAVMRGRVRLVHRKLHQLTI
ncbi:MAG: hypothetical protein HYV54_00495 [Parcubacteria group bacterium]|nr:hypothetical protein [Parcubacteria group bacterium]